MPRLACLALLLAACGGPSTTATPSTPAATPPPPAEPQIGEHPRAAVWDDPPLPDGAILRIGHASPYGEHTPGGVFSPDGRLFAWGDGDHVDVEVVTTGERVLHVDLPRRAWPALAFSPDGARIAAATIDGTLRAWAVDGDGAPALDVNLGRLGWGARIAYGALGIAVEGPSESIAIIDPETGAIRSTLQHPRGYLSQVAFSSSGALISIGDAGWARWDGDAPTFHARRSFAYAISTVRDEIAYDVQEGVAVADLDGNVQRVLDVALKPGAFTADGAALIGPLADRRVAVVDATTGEITRTLDCLFGPIAASADGRTIAVGTSMFDLARGVAIPEGAIDAQPIGFGANGDLYLRSVCALLRYDVATGAVLERIEGPDWELPWEVGDLAISPSGRRLVVHGNNQKIVVRDVGGDVVASREERTADLVVIDDDHVVFADTDHGADFRSSTERVFRWDLATDTTTELFSTPKMLFDLAASRDGAVVAVTTADGVVTRIDATSGDVIERRSKLTAVSAGFRDDGTLVIERPSRDWASYAWERWDVSTWKRLAQVPSWSAAWSHSAAPRIAPDALLAAHVDDDGMLHVFETTTMREAATWPCRDQQYALAAGGGLVAVRAPDRSLLVYEVAP